MVKTERFIVGTVKECINEIWKLIDWSTMTFPDFDFCIDPYEDAESNIENAEDGCDLGEAWCGAKGNYDFDPRGTSINVIFGYYGGGDFYSLCMYDDDEEYKEMIIQKMCDTANGELTPYSDTVIELIREGE